MAVVFEKGEYVLYEVRRHWFVFLFQVLVIMGIFFFPIVAYALVKTLTGGFDLGGNAFALLTFFYSIWLLGILMAVTMFWTDYYLDVLIITNKRVIDIEQRRMFSREISYLNLARIQDVKSDVHGIIPTLFKFGDINIQTAGQKREFVVRHLKDPNQVREKLNEALRAFN